VIANRPPGRSIAAQFFMNFPGASTCSRTSPATIRSNCVQRLFCEIRHHNIEAGLGQFPGFRLKQINPKAGRGGPREMPMQPFGIFVGLEKMLH
jgi:hypothetical protein